MRSRLIMIVATALVVCLATSALARRPKPKPKQVVPSVEVWVVRRTDLRQTITVQGRAAAWREAKLACEVAGVIAKFYHDVGDRVDRNKTLVQLDPANYKRRLAEAKANLDKAKATLTYATLNYRRLAALLRSRVTARSQLDESRSAYLRAQADVGLAKVAVEQAEYNLNKTKVVAPFPGVVLQRYREQGEMVAAGTILIHLADYRQIKIEIGLTEDQVVQVRPGQKVAVTFSVFKDRTFPGEIDVVGAAADADTGIFPVRIKLKNPDWKILPGMIAHARMDGRIIKDIVLVPAEAVIEQFGVAFVYIVNGRKAKRIPVKLGPAYGERRRILRGLKAGDKLIVVGQSQLRPDLPVKIVKVHR